MVSIPFKRESVFKEPPINTAALRQKRFNSLQTGKCIQSNAPRRSRPIRRVSIPFKREGVSKVISRHHGLSPNTFQFPSNGKAYPKFTGYGATLKWTDEFQFPSNGKAYPKPACCRNGTRRWWVSIPFKRESVSKDRFVKWVPSKWRSCFHSLQTGKSFRTIRISIHIMRKREKVSIPFKRESPFGLNSNVAVFLSVIFVSIPFKRESPFGQDADDTLVEEQVCFNSLQTGKSFRTRIIIVSTFRRFSFHSLQTGKSFRT